MQKPAQQVNRFSTQSLNLLAPTANNYQDFKPLFLFLMINILKRGIMHGAGVCTEQLVASQTPQRRETSSEFSSAAVLQMVIFFSCTVEQQFYI